MSRHIPYWLIGTAIIIALILTAVISVPISQTLIPENTNRDFTFSTDRRLVALPGGCVRAGWDVQGIQAIFVNQRPTVGTADEEICITNTPEIVWDVTFADGTQQQYTLPVTILSRNLAAQLAGGLAVVLAVIGVAMLTARYTPIFVMELRRRGVLQTVGLILFGVVVTLGLIEGLFRLYLITAAPERDRARYLYSIERLDALSTIYMGLPYLNYGMNPEHEWVNEMGYRGEMVSPQKPEDIYRVVTLGGSTTFGFELPTEETYPYHLQNILRFDYGYEGVEVVNLASMAYTSQGSVVNLGLRGINYEPDLVIIYHGINDAFYRMANTEDCFDGQNPLYGMGGEVGIWQYNRDPLPRSAAYRYIAFSRGWLLDPTGLIDRLENPGLCDNTGRLPFDEQVRANPAIYFERNLRSMIGMGEAHDFDVMLATFAWNTDDQIAEFGRQSPEVTEPARYAINEQNEVMRQLGEATTAYTYDFAAEMPNVDEYWHPDGFHQSAAGNRLQAELFASYIINTNLIK